MSTGFFCKLVAIPVCHESAHYFHNHEDGGNDHNQDQLALHLHAPIVRFRKRGASSRHHATHYRCFLQQHLRQYIFLNCLEYRRFRQGSRHTPPESPSWSLSRHEPAGRSHSEMNLHTIQCKIGNVFTSTLTELCWLLLVQYLVNTEVNTPTELDWNVTHELPARCSTSKMH